MRRGRIIHVAASALALFICGSGHRPAAAADEPCGLTPEWQALADHARVAARSGTVPPAEIRYRIATHLRLLDREALFDRIDIMQSEATRLRVEAVLDDLHDLDRSGDLVTPWIMALDLDEIQKTVTEFCGSAEAQLPFLSSTFEAIASVMGSDADDADNAHGVALTDYAKLALLPLFVGVLSALFFLLNQLLTWSQGLRRGRKTCRIEARIVIGSYDIPGAITVLGQMGCRFVAHDSQAQDLLGDVAESGETCVIAGPIRIPSNVAGTQPTHAAVLFQMPLPQPLQDQLLALSTVTPHYTRHKRIRRNVTRRPGAAPAPAIVETPGGAHPAPRTH